MAAFLEVCWVGSVHVVLNDLHVSMGATCWEVLVNLSSTARKIVMSLWSNLVKCYAFFLPPFTRIVLPQLHNQGRDMIYPILELSTTILQIVCHPANQDVRCIIYTHSLNSQSKVYRHHQRPRNSHYQKWHSHTILPTTFVYAQNVVKSTLETKIKSTSKNSYYVAECKSVQAHP